LIANHCYSNLCELYLFELYLFALYLFELYKVSSELRISPTSHKKIAH